MSGLLIGLGRDRKLMHEMENDPKTATYLLNHNAVELGARSSNLVSNRNDTLLALEQRGCGAGR